jgi:superoxide dismutase, Cu-Zn family
MEGQTMGRTGTLVAAAAIGVTSLGAVALQVTTSGATNVVARAELRNAADGYVGEVVFKKRGQEIIGTVEVDGLPGGSDFRGFHIHANDLDVAPADGQPDGCLAPAFTSVGGHWSLPGQSHGAHAGDLPVLMRDSSGHASATFSIGKFTPGDIIGRAVIVHAGPDNYANIPTRYSHASGTGADSTTLSNGDAGGRYACGVIVSARDNG